MSMCVCVYYRALHIAVVQGELAIFYKLMQLLLWAHRSLDIYNNLRQVIVTFVTFLSIKAQRHHLTAAISECRTQIDSLNLTWHPSSPQTDFFNVSVQFVTHMKEASTLVSVT